MTRTNCFSLLSCAALAAAIAAYGCGGGSTINGTGGTTAGGAGGRVDSGAIIIGAGGSTVRGTGGAPGGADAGFNMCMNNSPCTAGFTCEAACNVGGVAGVRNCTCGANGQLNCPGGNAGCIRPMADAGFNMCMNGFPCTPDFTCDLACMVGPIAGVRNCTCGANGQLNCPGGNAGCIRPDAGFNMCTAAFPCTAGFTCEQPCMVGNVAGMRACTCAANGTLNCPAGNAACIRPMPDGGPPDVAAPVDAPRDVPPPPVDAPRDVPVAG